MFTSPTVILILSAAILTPAAASLLWRAFITPPDDATRCRQCAYDLRGLPPVRCPECGCTKPPRPPRLPLTPSQRRGLVLLSLLCLIPAFHIAVACAALLFR